MLTSSREYKGRIHLMDTLRGVIIIGVVIYHTLFDLYAIYGLPIGGFLLHPFVDFVRDWGAGTLILMCGICCNLSHSNLKRGIECLIIALGFSAATWFFMRDEFIYFGILHFLAIAMLLYHFLQKPLHKIPGWVAIPVFVLFLFIFGMPQGYLGFCYQHMITLPKVDAGGYVTLCLGLWFHKSVKIFTADYFPIIPWILMFLTGVIVGQYFKAGKIPKFFYKDFCKPITWVGTKTMYIYVLHQPIVYGILYGIFWLIHRK